MAQASPRSSPAVPGGPDEPRLGRTEWTVMVMALALAAAVVVGVALVFGFVGEERDRELRDWQTRLGLVVDSRVAEVDGWLGRQRDEIAALAANPTIELILSDLEQAGGDLAAIADAEAQLAYVGNLLEVTANRAGFTGPLLGPDVPANVPRVALGGLALFDAAGRLLVSVPGGLPLPSPSEARSPELASGGIEVFRDASGQAALRLTRAVYPLQSEPRPGSEIGYVVGVKQLRSGLFALLAQPGATEASLETLLLRRRGGLVDYLSPLGDGRAPLSVALDLATPELAAAFAVEQPGGFADRRDYRDIRVLVTSRPLARAPWVVMTKIDAEEALAASDARLRRLLALLLLAIGLVAAALVAVWRHGASRRAARAAELYRATAEQLERQRNLLRLVTDTQPTSIFIADAEGRYRFANRVTAENAGISQEDMVGKSLDAVLGPGYAERYTRLNRSVLAEGQPIRDLVRYAANGSPERVLSCEHIPMTSAAAFPSSVLVVERDITAEVTERERRVRALNSLVETLVQLVDKRDPYAADHSKRVGALAASLAEEMALDDEQRDTARLAGTLMNLGKILVPSSLLGRSGSLSEGEHRQVRQSIQATASLLAGVEFDGPVVAALEQAQEKVDGSGVPAGLAGDEILEEARIIAVANSFIGMVSARAHRPGLSVDAACSELLKEVDRALDRRVVATLINYLDNRNGRAALAGQASPPAPF